MADRPGRPRLLAVSAVSVVEITGGMRSAELSATLNVRHFPMFEDLTVPFSPPGQ